MKHKRGQGMPVNFIVLIVIALIILVVLLVTVGGKITIFKKSTECAGRGGQCLSPPTGTCPDERPLQVFSNECTDKDGKKPGPCCIAVGS